MKEKLIIGAILLTSMVFSQQLVLDYQIGNFSKAESFSLAQNQFIYVTDSETNEIYKLDLTGNVLKSLGGYGWSESAFDSPVDIFASTLNVYVTDKNNDRVQFFDKDLNYISQFGSDRIDNYQYEFRYPTSAVISPLGDLFILDSDNSRILKFDLNGNFSLEVGNYDAGNFSLSNPIKFDISSDLRLFVLDEGEIKIFDQFGGGLTKIKIEEGAKNIQLSMNAATISYEKKILLLDPQKSLTHFEKYKLDEDSPIMDSFVFRNQLFVLTENYISVYKLPKE
ncbi:MAG: NHL repeat-containing protein [Melioribacteraceae bacterium]|jgi:DNA-binding beta-propeller fold protein YncE|nr:MAG: NHL repeat-containing protein [Melioribacteraceae bacterium]